ncbi:MAG: flagellar biosynthesis anti-sigma factor FlgM [Planctomycetota bacterium]|nr:MAG: flagellar biosynthesis anti-sigma factor FlgM [Planctomycetota bacterium]
MNISGIGGADSHLSIGQWRDGDLKTPSSLDTPDQITISKEAQYLEKLAESGQIRQEKIDAIREQIQNGTYLKGEKLEQAVSNMLYELGF